DEYVFESVCQYMSSRISQHQNVIPISVNISRLHLYQHDFIERYVKIKEKYQIPDQLLELEITENILLEDVKRVQTIVAELQAHGFLCSIDDFGSGYSSLNLLKDLPINVIKLDRFFLKDNYNVVRSYEIIKSVINMAKSIDIYTVAEGVETKEQQQFLQTIGCDMIQGYIFSKPLPIDEFNKYL
ncbi:MAG: EAL domain-containing protein, partial [Coprobacillus cateniformis]